ncbi:hypothetical protein HHI36_010180 [Cryptolaemus montrouzieri]|uniref:Uncharacterized protein n=1 Tax=Cryptolaemus montrouzieri TaxID=559131 RepID=A0ABD2MIR3_9CUCU
MEIKVLCTENFFLKELLRKLQEKNEILRENNALLLETMTEDGKKIQGNEKIADSDKSEQTNRTKPNKEKVKERESGMERETEDRT